MQVSDQFEQILEQENSTEREVHAFLKQFPYVLIHLFNKSWNFYHIFPEFRLGTDFRADFAVVSANSGRWEVILIELEGPRDSLYTKQGLPNRKLNWAIRQTNDWRDFVSEQKDCLRREVAKLVEPFNTYSHNNMMGKGGVPGHVELLHPETYISYDYCVVIGNSRFFSDSDRKAHKQNRDRTVATYDRVLNAMRDLESRNDTIEQRVKFLSKPGKGM